MDLKLYIKQAIQYQVTTGNAGYYAGTNPQTIVFNQGTLPAARQWGNYPNFRDETNSVSDIHKLQLTWTSERDQSGFPIVGSIQPKKSVSGTLTFEGEAYRLLKAWLIDDISATLNTVDVKIEHVGCGTYENYSIKSTDLTWCEDLICTFDVTLKQKDEPLNCLKRTIIADNWQGWFQPEPANGKQHPRFSYCNEIRPNGQLVMQWYFMSLTALIIYITTYTIFPVIAIIIAIILVIALIINGIISFINALGASLNFLNTSGLTNTLAQISQALGGGIQDSLGILFLEGAGCGREHPAPLIRDYITNVCDKCGVNVDNTTAPIFFATDMYVETSDPNRGNGGVIFAHNPHYNACYFFPQVVRGVRRWLNTSFFGNTTLNTTDFYEVENAPLLTLDLFLDQLKPLYNMEWMVRSINQGGQLVPYLYIQRKDFFKNRPGSYVYDFSPNGADRMKIVEGLCFQWNGKNLPAYTEGLYAIDAADTCGNEARYQTNGIQQFGNTDDNPNFQGRLEKITAFGAAKFRLDGASTDYIMDAMQVVTNASIFSPFTGAVMFGVVQPALEKYADYAVLLKDENCTMPKVIIWDGKSFLNARAEQTWYASSGQYGGVRPPINSAYNKNAYTWDYPGTNTTPFKHPPKTYVIGSKLTLVSSPYGAYQVADFLGIAQYIKSALLVNYPMYFEPGYQDTMWDWFHWIDDPTLNRVLNQTWSGKIQMCCEDLKTCKVFNDASDIILADKVKLDGNYLDGVITEITVNYDPADTYGQWIQLKGYR